MWRLLLVIKKIPCLILFLKWYKVRILFFFYEFRAIIYALYGAGELSNIGGVKISLKIIVDRKPRVVWACDNGNRIFYCFLFCALKLVN